jgi:hypothetical protein
MCNNENWGTKMPFVNRPPAFPLLPTGSLIKTNSKFGHELIAGPIIGNRQVVGHKEPGGRTRAEVIDSASRRYQFTEIVAPVNSDHGAVSWSRMEQQFGEQWDPFDNCQHAARNAYYGVPDSPTLTGVAVGATLLFLLWRANQN